MALLAIGGENTEIHQTIWLGKLLPAIPDDGSLTLYLSAKKWVKLKVTLHDELPIANG